MPTRARLVCRARISRSRAAGWLERAFSRLSSRTCRGSRLDHAGWPLGCRRDVSTPTRCACDRHFCGLLLAWARRNAFRAPTRSPHGDTRGSMPGRQRNGAWRAGSGRLPWHLRICRGRARRARGSGCKAGPNGTGCNQWKSTPETRAGKARGRKSTVCRLREIRHKERKEHKGKHQDFNAGRRVRGNQKSILAA